VTVDINAYLGRGYGSADERPCWLLVADYFWREHSLGVQSFKSVTPSVRAIATAFRLALSKGAHGFLQIDAPVDDCLVLLGRTQRLGLHHCGIYRGGHVLHAREVGVGGVVHEAMSTVQDYYRVREFWALPALLEAAP